MEMSIATPCKVICLIRDSSQDVEKVKARILQNHAHLNPSDYQLLIEVVNGNPIIHHYHYQGYSRSCDLLEYTGNGSGFGDEKKDQLGVIILEQYHIYSEQERFKVDYHAFYQYIHHLFSMGQYGKIIYHIHQYEISTYRSFKSRSPEDDALSLCYHFYAKALEMLGMDDIAVVDAYKRAYQRSDKNLVSMHELLIKFRENHNIGAGLKLYYEVYGKEYSVKSLIHDQEGDMYLEKLAEIRESHYFGEKSGNYPVALCFFEMELMDLLIRAKEYRSAYQIGNRMMLRAEMIPQHVIREIQLKKAECIDHVRNDLEYIGYPEAKILELAQKRELLKKNDSLCLTPSNERRGVIFTITTCKRYDLFEKTINSFINCVTHNGDLDLITEWLCVDDNSSQEDRIKMVTNYPFFEYVFKGPEAKGHIPSMNIIRDYVLAKGYKYTIHFEDDWQSVCPIPTIQRSIDIMKADPEIKQVVHNRNYVQLIRQCDIDLPGGYLRQVPTTGDRYILHQFYMQGSPEFIAFQQQMGVTIANWPYYSLNPSLLDTAVYQRLGPFEKRTWHFEFDYAVAFMCAGFKTAFLDGIYRIHIGKLLGDETTQNAYELNNEIKIE
jgi:hypothetical protein